MLKPCNVWCCAQPKKGCPKRAPLMQFSLLTPNAFFHSISFIMQMQKANFNLWGHLEDENFAPVLLSLSVIKDIAFFFFFSHLRTISVASERALHTCLPTGQANTTDVVELPCWLHVNLRFWVVLVERKWQQHEPKSTAVSAEGSRSFLLDGEKKSQQISFSFFFVFPQQISLAWEILASL